MNFGKTQYSLQHTTRQAAYLVLAPERIKLGWRACWESFPGKEWNWEPASFMKQCKSLSKDSWLYLELLGNLLPALGFPTPPSCLLKIAFRMSVCFSVSGWEIGVFSEITFHLGLLKCIFLLQMFLNQKKSSQTLKVLSRNLSYCRMRGQGKLLCFLLFHSSIPLQREAGDHTCVGNITDMLGSANVSLAHQVGIEWLHLKVI